MDVTKFYANPDEKPLDNLVEDGGFCKIFRTIGCIGDSLSSGELESFDEGIPGFHDFYEYSWGQFMARTLGSKVYNFSKGGMTAKEFFNSFAQVCGAYKYENLCQAYIIALGVNDLNLNFEMGTVDIDKVEDTILSYYIRIIKTIKSKQPDAKFFLMTMPNDVTKTQEAIEKNEAYSEAIRTLAEKFKNTYVLDFRKYAPVYDQKFKDTFFLGHMTPTGYVLTAKMVMSYIDYIIRNNPEDFSQVGFIGTPYKYNK